MLTGRANISCSSDLMHVPTGKPMMISFQPVSVRDLIDSHLRKVEDRRTRTRTRTLLTSIAVVALAHSSATLVLSK
jgi:hypothetical protein